MNIKTISAAILAIIALIPSYKYLSQSASISAAEDSLNKSIQNINSYHESLNTQLNELAESCEDFIKKQYDQGVYDVKIRTGLSWQSWKNDKPPIRNCEAIEDSAIRYRNNPEEIIIGAVIHCDAGLFGYTKDRLPVACKTNSTGDPRKIWIVTSETNWLTQHMANKYELLQHGSSVVITDKSILESSSFPFNDKAIDETQQAYHEHIDSLEIKVSLLKSKLEAEKSKRPSLLIILCLWLTAIYLSPFFLKLRGSIPAPTEHSPGPLE